MMTEDKVDKGSSLEGLLIHDDDLMTTDNDDD